MQLSLDLLASIPSRVQIAADSWLLKGFATTQATELLTSIAELIERAPFRQQLTPLGHSIAAAMSNCGSYGWISDHRGYRYSQHDPHRGQPWPAMPQSFSKLATTAAAAAGYQTFTPQACLINRYQQGQGMGLHQDRNEQDLSAPIVSVSLGAPIIFMFGGLQRNSRPSRWLLEHGDVVVWGGVNRLAYHGVAPLTRKAQHPLTGPLRYNLTFRQVELSPYSGSSQAGL